MTSDSERSEFLSRPGEDETSTAIDAIEYVALMDEHCSVAPLRVLSQQNRLRDTVGVIKPLTVSTAQLRAFQPVHSRPINLVVYQGSYSLKGMGELISRTASRLDAFSGYPFRA